MKESANEESSEQERYIHALELQVETFALLASRLASLLQPSRTEGTQDNLPYLRPNPRLGRKAMAALEVAQRTSGSPAPTAKGRSSSNATPHKIARQKTEEYKAKNRAWQKKYYAKRKAERLAAKQAAQKKEPAA